MLKFTVRYQAKLPIRRSYKPVRRLVLRVRPRRPDHEPDFDAACAPEGAWALTRTE